LFFVVFCFFCLEKPKHPKTNPGKLTLATAGGPKPSRAHGARAFGTLARNSKNTQVLRGRDGNNNNNNNNNNCMTYNSQQQQPQQHKTNPTSATRPARASTTIGRRSSVPLGGGQVFHLEVVKCFTWRWSGVPPGGAQVSQLAVVSRSTWRWPGHVFHLEVVRCSTWR
jgi:hypothetical protein